MADDGMPDYDLDGLLDWIYVEDDFPLADELAESQIPDPGYAGTRAEIEMDDLFDEFDIFDYWDDLQYGDDSYWDYGARGAQAGRKRKPSTGSKTKKGKRRKITLAETGGGNVLFVRAAERDGLGKDKPLSFRGNEYALFPDWRRRFENDTGAPLQVEMPAAMKNAAEGKDEETAIEMESEEGEDEQEGLDEDTLEDRLLSVDPEKLKSDLLQQLADAGLDTMDENVLMHAVSQMLSGKGTADELSDTLAEAFMKQATSGNDATISWLSRQGVDIPEEEIPEEEIKRQDFHISPSDSAVEMLKAVGGPSAELAIHPSSPSSSMKKRTAADAHLAAQSAKKRKKVSFDMPASSSSQQNNVPELQDNMVEQLDPLTSEDPLMFEPTIPDEKTRAAKSKAANAIAVDLNESTSGGKTGPNATSSKARSDGENEPTNTAENKSTKSAPAPAPARQTRKRKAKADEGEVENDAPMKQARTTAGPAEAAGRRTRSTRAATKAGK